MTTVTFEPRWASAPGETLVAALSRQGHSVEDLADELNVSDAIARGLVTGAVALTEQFASAIAQLTGASADFWLRREERYRDSLRWISLDAVASVFPLELGKRMGWIDEVPTHWRDRAARFTDYFDVSNIEEWEAQYGAQSASLLRASASFDTDPLAQALWLRQAERAASLLSLGAWSRSGFFSALGEARALTRVADPRRFVPELQRLLALVGVAVVILQTPEHVPVSGVARRLRDGTPLIVLSARHLSDDHFWFTFFHEAGHVALHDLADGFVDEFNDDQSTDDAEHEANEFARHTLVPSGLELLRQSASTRTLSHRDVARFASHEGIAAGVVVGQLHHDGAVPANQLNRLRRRYRWANGELVPADPS